MANKVLLITGVIIFGVVATIIAINYYYHHPTRPFYLPPATSGKLDKFGIKKSTYLNVLVVKNGITTRMIPKTTRDQEEKDHQRRSCSKMMMVAGKYKVLRCVMAC